MTMIWTDDEYLRLDCEEDAEEREPAIAGICDYCRYDVPETEVVTVRSRLFHEACAYDIWGESQGD